MGHFRLWLASGVLAACSGTSTEGLFDQPGAGGNPSSGGSSGSQGLAGTQSFGGSNGVAGSGGVAGVQGIGGSSSGGAAGTDSFGGSGAIAGSSGTGGVQGSGGSSGTAGSAGSAGSAGAPGGTGGDPMGGRDGGVIDPVDASGDGAADVTPRCPTGNYAGTLSGPYQSRLGSSQFVARVEFAVSNDGAVQGKLTATSNTTGKASLEGKLDCTTGSLEMDILDGSYSDVLGTVRYTGTMTATYRADARSFPNGHWTATETSNPSYGGEGTWSANASVSASGP